MVNGQLFARLPRIFYLTISSKPDLRPATEEGVATWKLPASLDELHLDNNTRQLRSSRISAQPGQPNSIGPLISIFTSVGGRGLSAEHTEDPDESKTNT